MNPGLTQALTQLQLAYGLLNLPNWQQHAAAIAASVHGLTTVYLHVDALTGAHDPAPIYLDPQRVVLGLIPRAVEPLVRLLQRQTARLDEALAGGVLMPDAEAPAWEHWHERLAAYVASLERALANPNQPSEALWREVTAPLIQGLYPPNFVAFGIANPAAPSKPDATTVPTTAFMVALQGQEVSELQAWLLQWRQDAALWLRQTQDALSRYFEQVVAASKRGTRRVLGAVAVTVALVGVIWVGTQVTGPKRSPPPPPPPPPLQNRSKQRLPGRRAA